MSIIRRVLLVAAATVAATALATIPAQADPLISVGNDNNVNATVGVASNINSVGIGVGGGVWISDHDWCGHWHHWDDHPDLLVVDLGLGVGIHI